jgi:hypothetical protein
MSDDTEDDDEIHISIDAMAKMMAYSVASPLIQAEMLTHEAENKVASQPDEMEQIVGVAIRYGDLIIPLPSPKRHADVLNHMIRDLEITEAIDPIEDGGFYTTSGKYLRRGRAAMMAQMTGQCKEPKGKYLTSEDLW